MLQKLLVFSALSLLLTATALAGDDDLAAGFHLGKFYTTAAMLADELMILDELATQLHVADITQENLDSGAISDEDVDNAKLVLAYATWRVEYFILPACDAGLATNAMSHDSLHGLKAPTQAILAEVQQLCDAFVDVGSYEGLAALSAALTGEYSHKLFDLAETARFNAGESYVADEVANKTTDEIAD